MTIEELRDLESKAECDNRPAKLRLYAYAGEPACDAELIGVGNYETAVVRVEPKDSDDDGLREISVDQVAYAVNDEGECAACGGIVCSECANFVVSSALDAALDAGETVVQAKPEDALKSCSGYHPSLHGPLTKFDVDALTPYVEAWQRSASVVEAGRVYQAREKRQSLRDISDDDWTAWQGAMSAKDGRRPQAAECGLRYKGGVHDCLLIADRVGICVYADLDDETYEYGVQMARSHDGYDFNVELARLLPATLDLTQLKRLDFIEF